MPIRIPDQHKPVVVKLAALPEKTVEELADALRKTKPAISPSALAKQLAAPVDLPIADLTALLAVLLSLTITRIARKVSAEDMAKEVAEAAAKEGLGGVKPGTPSVELLRSRMATLLSVGPALEVTGRAAEIYFAHETLFHAARVLSDIRPIFGSGQSQTLVAGMIVHNLEITIARQRAVKPEFIALNIHDLHELRRVIERAIEKDRVLKELILNSKLTYVEDVPNEHQT